jgi:phage baseplate assembly protein W
VRTLLLREGDLVLGPTGHETVSGSRMIEQDLSCALREPLGTDRFHPGYGSHLEGMIGLNTQFASFAVQQEVQRVVQNYVAVQRDKIERDALRGVRSRYRAGDVVADVVGVEITPVQDHVKVRVHLRTAADGNAVLTTTVGAL